MSKLINSAQGGKILIDESNFPNLIAIRATARRLAFENLLRRYRELGETRRYFKSKKLPF